MVASPERVYLTPEEYLEAEKNSLIKHEYIRGEVYAMTGTSDAHNIIAGNIFALLRSHLRGRGCRIYFADVKTRIESQDIFFYPDLLVPCDSRDRATAYYKCFPKLIVEVLSDSTEAFDRGDKFAHYRHLPSLEEYVLVSQKRPQVECFRRTQSDRNPEQWTLQIYEAGQTVELTSISWQGAIADCYEDVEFAT